MHYTRFKLNDQQVKYDMLEFNKYSTKVVGVIDNYLTCLLRQQ